MCERRPKQLRLPNLDDPVELLTPLEEIYAIRGAERVPRALRDIGQIYTGPYILPIDDDLELVAFVRWRGK